MPTFIDTRNFVKATYADAGEHCSTRKAHRIAEALFNQWNGDDEVPLTHSDPTGETAVWRVLAGL